MIPLKKGCQVLACLAVLLLAAAPAPAARVVRKTTEHTYHGTVIGVHRKGNTEHLTISSSHRHRSRTGIRSTTRHRHHTFTVSQRTQVVSPRGPVGMRALHRGEHVTVQAHGNHADRVTVAHHVTKHRKKRV